MREAGRIQYLPDEELTVIPPGAPGTSTGFAVFDDSVGALRAFVLGRLGRRGAVVPAPRAAKCDALIPVVVGLVPRPDNSHNPRAVSVTAPPRQGGSVLDRHMGYLYDSSLHFHGAEIHRLAEVAGTAVGCHGWIELGRVDAYEYEDDEGDDAYGDGPPSGAEESRPPGRRRPFTRTEQLEAGYWIGGVRLNLPDADELRSLVTEFLEAAPAAEGSAPGPAPAGPPADVPAGPPADAFADVPAEPSADTSTDIPAVGAAGKPAGARASGVTPTQPGLREALHGQLAARLRSALAVGAASGARGRETARDRAQARRDERAETELRTWARYRRRAHPYEDVRAVSRTVHGARKVLVTDRAGVEIGEYHLPDGPLTLFDERVRREALAALRRHGVEPAEPLAPGELAALDGYPDATVVPGPVWSIRLIEDAVAARDLPQAASYDPGTGTLTVHARPYAEPMTALLRRHGVEPARVTWAAPDADTEALNRRAASGGGYAGPLRSACRLTPRALGLVPRPHRQWLNALPVEPPAATGRGRDFAAHGSDAYYRRELGEMFGAPLVPDRTAPCRLCGRPALEARDRLAYCFGCCRLARRGVLRDNGTDGPWTDATIHALRRLVRIEFSGPPSLAQLDRVTVTDPRVADEAMLCRFLIPRPAARLLTARPARAARSWAQWLQLAGVLDDGVRRARGTLTVATDGHLCRSMLERHIDDFFHHWRVEHEPEPHYPRHAELNTTGLRADWRLGDGTFVEALGLMEQPRYNEKAQRKIELARVAGIRLVTLTAADLDRLPEIFAPWLRERTPGG
ncbi:hypothetical protein [Streptomyces sp. PTD5-9]|uniref:hypothetical protein n=1 Tax=Streptomyces sp. PTD5-9 TaxID=3120150 RepID=UPI003008BAC4